MIIQHQLWEQRSKKERALSYTWMKPTHIYDSIILLETKYTIHFFLNTSMAYNSEALYDMYMYVQAVAETYIHADSL